MSKIKITGKPAKKIDPNMVAKALGARPGKKVNPKDLPLPPPAPVFTGIAQKMMELIEKYKTFKGYAIRLGPECVGQWGPHYAIADGYRFDKDTFCECEDDEYNTHTFDASKLRSDFEKEVVAHFGPGAKGFRETRNNKEYDKLPFGTLIVAFHTQEIEVYNKGCLVIDNEEFLERKDQILNVLNMILDPASWHNGNCGKGWVRKMSIVHQVQRIFE